MPADLITFLHASLLRIDPGGFRFRVMHGGIRDESLHFLRNRYDCSVDSSCSTVPIHFFDSCRLAWLSRSFISTGLPLFRRQKCDGGLGAAPPVGVKGAAPLVGSGQRRGSLARYGKNQGSKHCFKGISMFLEAVNNLH